MRAYLAAFVALLLILTACPHGTYKTSYTVAATTKAFVEESHGIYDEEANLALAACVEKKERGEVTTQKDMDACLGPFFRRDTQEKVVQGLALYNATATAFSAVMLGCEPSADGSAVSAATCIKRSFTDAELREWTGKVVRAAVQVLELFPKADQKLKKLDMLVGGLR